MTDSPLKGLALAREAGTILAWDEGNQLYLFDVRGESLSYSRVPEPHPGRRDQRRGRLIALLVEAEDAGLLLLDADFVGRSSRSPRRREASFVHDRPARALSGGRHAGTGSCT